MRSTSQDDGADLWSFVQSAYPICRSITGAGVRRTLELVAETLPIEIHEVPTGTPVLDWTVPREWNVTSAWIEGPGGERIADLARHNLHLMSYSVPVQKTLRLSQLQDHLHSLPEQPDLIPYRTSYYREDWAFCLADAKRRALADGDYEVRIDSTLSDGSLTYGELLLPGTTTDEVLFSTHVCHPSLANDNLSGIAVCMGLAERLAQRRERRYSYRFVFVPGTIGAITWLARNPGAVARVRAGLVAANLGDAGGFHYKRSRRGDAWIDRAVEHTLTERGGDFEIEDFVPFGYDERQYCSPGFDLAVGSLTRTPWGRYPEYHTSADDLEFITLAALEESVATYAAVVDLLETDAVPEPGVPEKTTRRTSAPTPPAEGNATYRNLSPKGEPQLGRRGLYAALGGDFSRRESELALLWVLNLSDGTHDLRAIAERSGIGFEPIRLAADRLIDAELLAET